MKAVLSYWQATVRRGKVPRIAGPVGRVGRSAWFELAMTVAALLATAGCGSQVGDSAEMSRVRKVHTEVFDALGFAPDHTDVRGVGCRYEDCASVRGTVSLEQNDPREACRHVREVFADLELRLEVDEPIEDGCRFTARYGDYQVGASVSGSRPVTVSVRATAIW